MTFRTENDIVRRALIALLPPNSLAPESTGNTHVCRENFCGRGSTLVMNFGAVVAESFPARVSIVEQRTSQTLSVCWSDSQSGHYADQVWRKGVARRASFCVLTGTRIYPGDSVFQPRACATHVPANRDHMILAAVLHEDANLLT
ncbi:DUF3331 domain-containing protein [Paraburkholderia guartelaensis]|uniref:DUF3331 domain-containing protein n=1 Tax=Paraburkholderia guartelaensis TaxID=2546446 RepID=UPI002AB69F2C|nr:DUF3331 domain-containing protein [Paraburkholderia guartelaensis]